MRTVSILLCTALAVTVGTAACGSPADAGSPAEADTAPSTESSPAALVLSDQGVGALKLGVSTKEALASGLVGEKDPDQTGDSCVLYEGLDGVTEVIIDHDQVIVIDVDASIRTASGIGIGDTYAQVHTVLPDLEIDPTTDRSQPDAPGAALPAIYRIAFDDGPYPDSKILELGLQWKNQPCYE